MKLKSLAILTLGLGLLSTNSEACSRITFMSNDNNTLITGRSMDWAKTFSTELKVFPRGVTRKSTTTHNPITWKAKYGTLGIFDSHLFLNAGVNEKGLAGDFLWLEGADYGTPKKDENTISAIQYLQYLLDNFASVQEVEDFVKTHSLRPVASKNDVPSHIMMQIHWILTDKTGDNLIIEADNGSIKTYRQKGKIVMTNEPAYDKMLAISDYFKKAGIEGSMPGSAISEARFVYLTGWLDQFVDTKLDNYSDSVSNHDFNNQALMSVVSLMRGVSTPLGVKLDPAHPNNTTTLYRTYVDLTNNMFYYDSALTPSFVFVNLNDVDFSKEKSLELANGAVYNGNVLDLMK